MADIDGKSHHGDGEQAQPAVKKGYQYKLHGARVYHRADERCPQHAVAGLA